MSRSYRGYERTFLEEAKQDRECLLRLSILKLPFRVGMPVTELVHQFHHVHRHLFISRRWNCLFDALYFKIKLLRSLIPVWIVMKPLDFAGEQLNIIGPTFLTAHFGRISNCR